MMKDENLENTVATLYVKGWASRCSTENTSILPPITCSVP